MATKRRPADIGTERARTVLATIGRDIRDARLDRDLSLRSVASAIGRSQSHVSRVERGLVDRVSVLDLARLEAVVGLQLGMTSQPGGSPIRDAAQQMLLADFCAELHDSLRWTPEVLMPRLGDPRAWDLVIRGDGWLAAVEAETGPRDGQALVRQIAAKQRDSELPSVILLLRATVRTRRFLADAGDSLRPAFPIDGDRALARLRAGDDPGGNALIILPARPRRLAPRARTCRGSK